MKLEDLKHQRTTILRLAEAHGARNVRVFGSVARGEATEESDLNLLVALEPGTSLLDLGGFLVELQSTLACEVDVVTERCSKTECGHRCCVKPCRFGGFVVYSGP